MRPRLVWGAILGSVIAYDLRCARNPVEGDTFSEVTRDLLQVHTPAGRAVFLGAWAALTAWFLPHILRKATSSS